MLEGNLGCSFDTVNDRLYIAQDCLCTDTAPEHTAALEYKIGKQLELDLGDTASDCLASSSLLFDTQVTETAYHSKKPRQPPSSQERACELDQVERIHHLEQALDQCQIYINELKLQLMNQQFLKDQLAATEEISHIHQQAITALKTQLADQQALGAQAAEVTQQKMALQTAFVKTQSVVQVQQVELEHLKTQLHQEQTAAQAFQTQLEQQITHLLMVLEAQKQQTQALESQEASAHRLADNLITQFEVAQKKVEVLQSHLSDRKTTIVHLESQLQRSKKAVATQQEVLTALQQTQAPETEKNHVIQGLSKNLLQAHTKIEALETEFASQLMLQAKLQHSCQELEVQRDLLQNRLGQLEQQVSEMQEQILKQAQQASEYEAAVQHWKEQCLFAEHSVLQLKAVLEQILKERPPELVTTTNTESEVTELTDSDESEPSRFLRGLKLDLPSFLHLRRNFKL